MLRQGVGPLSRAEKDGAVQATSCNIATAKKREHVT